MRILLVSSGLKPDHFGGLPSHVEDVLNGLIARGHDVGYLNTGKKSKYLRTRFKRRNDLGCPAWDLSSRRAFTRYWTGTLEPIRQVYPSRAYAKAFLTVIREFRPDIIHFQELTSFPISLVRELKREEIKVIYSAADFYPLCPTVKLLRPDGTLCTRKSHELDCDLCSTEARYNMELRWEYAVDHWFPTMIKVRNLGRRIIRFTARIAGRKPSRAEYQQRRRDFEKFLAALDRVLVTSNEQAAVFETRVPGTLRMHFLQRSRATIRSDRPAPRTGPVRNEGFTFLALNIVNPAKGLALLEETFTNLAKDFPGTRLNLYGLEEGRTPGIRRFGPYDDSELDEMVAKADFGILPSIWPEAFGYVGPEMLSRGLPVIASNVGAMPDYVTDRENGLLFDPTQNGSLEAAIRGLLNDSKLRAGLWRGAATGTRRYLTLGEHLDGLTDLYSEVLEEGRTFASSDS